MHEPRTYRLAARSGRWIGFEVHAQETDLFIQAHQNLEKIGRELALGCRGFIESYIAGCPEFLHALEPWKVQGPAPEIVRTMAWAGRMAGVGPMAAVAGAIAECVGAGLRAFSPEVVVENGGDIFLKVNEPVVIGIFAGNSPLSMKTGIRLQGRDNSFGVCTSSATVGHSLSFGKADAVCVISRSCALADAAATALCNQVRSSKDISKVMKTGKNIQGIEGIVVVIGKDIGFWGNLEVVPLAGKKG